MILAPNSTAAQVYHAFLPIDSLFVFYISTNIDVLKTNTCAHSSHHRQSALALQTNLLQIYCDDVTAAAGGGGGTLLPTPAVPCSCSTLSLTPALLPAFQFRIQARHCPDEGFLPSPSEGWDRLAWSHTWARKEEGSRERVQILRTVLRDSAVDVVGSVDGFDACRWLERCGTAPCRTRTTLSEPVRHHLACRQRHQRPAFSDRRSV